MGLDIDVITCAERRDGLIFVQRYYITEGNELIAVEWREPVYLVS